MDSIRYFGFLNIYKKFIYLDSLTKKYFLNKLLINIYVLIFFYESTICVYILHQFKKTFFISVPIYMLDGIACKFMN